MHESDGKGFLGRSRVNVDSMCSVSQAWWAVKTKEEDKQLRGSEGSRRNQREKWRVHMIKKHNAHMCEILKELITIFTVLKTKKKNECVPNMI